MSTSMSENEYLRCMGEFSLAAICWRRFTHESERSRSSVGEAAVEDAEEDWNLTAEFENSDR